jgi:two-component sensor histidine kinase
MESRESLLLREINHRCGNDLQMIVSLLGLQSRRTKDLNVREALEEAMDRVAALGQARASHGDLRPTLEAALRKVSEALRSRAEPQDIRISLSFEGDVPDISDPKITTIAIAANELATNAVKHAFREDKSGKIDIMVCKRDPKTLIVIVDDDGLPFPELSEGRSDGLGLGLIRSLLGSVGATLLMPRGGSKRFEMIVPIGE